MAHRLRKDEGYTKHRIASPPTRTRISYADRLLGAWCIMGRCPVFGEGAGPCFQSKRLLRELQLREVNGVGEDPRMESPFSVAVLPPNLPHLDPPNARIRIEHDDPWS